MIKNTTRYQDDYLALRISLIPININDLKSNIKNFNYEDEDGIKQYTNVNFLDVSNIVATLNVSIEDSKKFKYITSSDLNFYYIIDSNNKRLKLSKEYNIVPPNIIIAKINPSVSGSIKEELQFEAYPSIGKGSEHARFIPVTNIEYWFKEDENKLTELVNQAVELNPDTNIVDFRHKNKENTYLKTDEGKPKTICIKFTTKGSMTPPNVLTQAINILLDKIESFKKDILELKSSTQYTEFWSTTNNNAMQALDIITSKYGHTIGNIITQYARHSNDVDFIAYKVPHPLKNEMIIRIRSKNYKSHEENFKNCKNILEKTATKVIEILTEISQYTADYFAGNL